jgi:hypothetical protein
VLQGYGEEVVNAWSNNLTCIYVWMAWWACNSFDGFLKILDGWHIRQFNLFHGMLVYIFLLLEHLVDGMVDLYVQLLYKIICFISICLSRMEISNYYISRNIYQQRFNRY